MIFEEEEYEDFPYFRNKHNYPIKGTSFLLGVFIFITMLRSQVPEVKLTQLVPGLYLLYLLLAFLFLTFLSSSTFRFTKFLETRPQYGRREPIRMQSAIRLRWVFFFFFTVLGIILNSVIPISLDSFRTAEKKSVDGSWTYGQVLFLENFLLFVLIVLSQTPIVFLNEYFNEKDIRAIPKIWRKISFIVLIGSGFLTPTVDIATQLSFAFSILFTYFVMIDTVTKRYSGKIQYFHGFCT